MSLEHIAQTLFELICFILILYGFKNEKKLIKWEQKQIKKIKKFIYNLIVKMEG